jgi:hypothetical protein
MKPQQQTPATASSSLMTFWDIESLSNVFSICAYTPRRHDVPDDLDVFVLVDDQAIAEGIEPQAVVESITTNNPGLPQVVPRIHDLSTEAANWQLAQMMGLSDAEVVNDPEAVSSFPASLRPVCDTDSDYDPGTHAFLAGYNSQNYDSVLLALYLSEVFGPMIQQRDQLEQARQYLQSARTREDQQDAAALFEQQQSCRQFGRVSAARMREHSNQMFSDEFKDFMPSYIGWDSPAAQLRRSMLMSGRHLDVARLNELQFKVSLKRLLGMLGYQIKESEKLGHDSQLTTPDEVCELLAYNVSDCLGLSQLFQHPTYSSAFDLKSGLLHQYAETIWTNAGQVRRDRLNIDSTSAKFVARILSPQGKLSDIEAVSYTYPHPQIAREMGIEPVNVLTECQRFFEQNVAPDRETNPDQAEAYRQFMQVVDYYASIEGQNFNDSSEYAQKFGLPARSLRDVPKRPNNLPYFMADGQPSSCFATFSTGGIHGAEIDKKGWDGSRLDRAQQMHMILRAKTYYPEATSLVAEAKRQHRQLSLPDGSTVDKNQVLIGAKPETAKYRKPKRTDPDQAEQIDRARRQLPEAADLLARQRSADQALYVWLPDGSYIDGKIVLATTGADSATYREEPRKKEPELFVAKDDGSTKLHPSFARTSAGSVIHEDFTSYYPSLLRNLRAFYNPRLGEDRYAQIFFDKQRYGQQMNQPGITAQERERLNILRNGTKLILNSASGAGDTTFGNSPIRMNNQIISMRIIGQLFSWRIGQAQTLAGARIISTNTDGLYSILDAETNNRILQEQQQAIHVDIEPEPMFLISKDSNNRLELVPPEGEGDQVPVQQWRIQSAGGGTLACHTGPRPDKALAHPAVIDFALAKYLHLVASQGESALAEPFDQALGRSIIESAIDHQDPVKTASLFQNVIAASQGSITYPFAAAPLDQRTSQHGPDLITAPRALQMVNRVFVVRAGTPGAVSLHNAGAWKVPPASQMRRREDPETRLVERDPVAQKILRHHGWAADRWTANTQGMALLPPDQDVVTRRINGIDPSWSMLVHNEDLHVQDKTSLNRLIDSLDVEIYTHMLAETFEKNWRNSA